MKNFLKYNIYFSLRITYENLFKRQLIVHILDAKKFSKINFQLSTTSFNAMYKSPLDEGIETIMPLISLDSK